MRNHHLGLMEQLFGEFHKIKEQKKESERLRFYGFHNGKAIDAVCEYLGWKNPGRVIAAIKNLYLYYAKQDGKGPEEGKENFQKFCEWFERVDQDGCKYLAIHPQTLDYAKSLRKEQYSKRSANGAQTKRKGIAETVGQPQRDAEKVISKKASTKKTR